MTHSEACDILGIREGAEPDIVTKAFNKLNSDITRQIESAGSKFLRETLIKNRKALTEAYHFLIKGSETEGSLSFSDAYKMLLNDESDSIQIIEDRFIKLKSEYEFGLRAPNKKIREIATADIKIISDVFEHIISNVKSPAADEIPRAYLESIRDDERKKLELEFERKYDSLKRSFDESNERFEDKISALSSEKTRILNDLTKLIELIATEQFSEATQLSLKLESKYSLNFRTSELQNLRTSEPQTSEFKPQTSDFKPQTSDFKPQTSDFKPQTSDFKPQTSDFKPLPGDSGFGIENVSFDFADDHIDRMLLDQSKKLSPKIETPPAVNGDNLDSRTVAEKLFSEGRFQDALFYFKEAKGDQPEDYSLDVYIQELEHLVTQENEESGNKQKTQENYEKEAYEEVLKEANTLRAAKNFSDALEIYNSLLLSDPDNPYLLYCKTECEDELKRHRETGISSGLATKPTQTELLSLKRNGDDLMNKKNFAGALELYKKALKINPKDIYLQIVIDQCTREIAR
ncbi:MAG: tetratricopeptide repeat protein [Bacteroidetes bacterium]|nr:tetratricopeptide repeat protein [Bacteroidota bacterium]